MREFVKLYKVGVTVHFNGENAFMAGCSDGSPDARLTEKQPSLVSILLVLAHIHSAHLAVETGIVKCLSAAQRYLLQQKYKVVCLFNKMQQPTCPFFMTFLHPPHLMAVSSYSSSSMSSTARGIFASPFVLLFPFSAISTVVVTV